MVEKEEKPTKIERTQKYLIYLLVVLILVDILDAYMTNFTNSFPSLVIAEFLSEYPDDEATAIYALCLGIATLGTFFVFASQALADKLGRKLMLTLTTFGMGFSALMLALSTNIVMYTIFLFMMYMFFSSDMWLIFVNEESPPDKRGLYSNIILAFGVIGPILMPIFRTIYITDQNANWRGMTYFPILLGIPLAIMIALTIKETSKYEEAKIKDNIEPSTISVRDNLKEIFAEDKDNHFKALLVLSLFNGFNYVIITLGEQYIAVYGKKSQSLINLLIIIIALTVIVGYLLTGVSVDKIGRKPVLMFYTILQPLAVILLVIGVVFLPGVFVLMAIGFALSYLAFWGGLIVLRLIVLEIVSTDKRGTGSGTRAFVSSIGISGGLFMSAALIIFFGMSMMFIMLTLPGFLSIIIILKYVKETKDVDLSNVK